MEILNVLTRGARGTIRVNRHLQKKTCNRIKKTDGALLLPYCTEQHGAGYQNQTVQYLPPPGFLPFPKLTGGVRRMNHKKTNVNIMQAQTWMASQDPLKKKLGLHRRQGLC